MLIKIAQFIATPFGTRLLKVSAIAIAIGIQYGYILHVEKRAYNNGYTIAKAEYADAAKTQSERIAAALDANFTQYQIKLNQLNEVNYEKLNKISKQYEALGNCHTVDGIGMLNEQIKRRHTGSGNKKTPTKP